MRSGRPLLSVLIPAYNAESYILSCIKSLLVQTYDHIELLICDDGSTDRTWMIAKSFDDPRISVFRNARNLGKNETCSFLLEKAKGDYVTVHDADDISSPCRFEKQMKFLIDNGDYVLCGTNFISFLDGGKVIGKSQLVTDYEAIRELITKSSQFHGPTIVFKRSVIDKVGGLYRYFTRAEDIDFTMRVTEKFRVCNLPDHLYYYRHHSGSLTNQINGYGIERLAHHRLLYHLAEERRANGGVDTLMRGDMVQANALIRRFQAEYENDPELPLRLGVFRLLDMQMYRNAVVLAWITVARNPSLANVKCFIFSIMKFFRGNYRLFMNTERIRIE